MRNLVVLAALGALAVAVYALEPAKIVISGYDIPAPVVSVNSDFPVNAFILSSGSLGPTSSSGSLRVACTNCSGSGTVTYTTTPTLTIGDQQ